VIVDISVAILAGRELEDPHVCHGKPARGSFDRDFDELEVRNKGKILGPP